jgi:heterodisulfide reductase subunit C
MGLIVDYKARALNLTQDVALAPSMFAKGKLKIMPELIKNRKNIKQIFQKTINKKQK